MAKYTPRRALGQVRNKANLWYRYHIQRNRPKAQLLVFAEPRSGSNLLLDYISTHEQISVREEILNPWAPIGIPKWIFGRGPALRHIRQSLAEPTYAAACKLMLHHLRYFKIALDDIATCFPEARFVIIYRQDLLQQFVSMQKLKATGVHKMRPDKDPSSQIEQVDVNPEQLSRYCRRMKEQYGELLAHEGIMNRAILFSYEELSAKPQEICSAVFTHMGCTPVTVVSQLMKQERRPIHEVIGNYKEITDFVESGETRMAFDPILSTTSRNIQH